MTCSSFLYFLKLRTGEKVFVLGRIKKQSCFSSRGFSKFDEGGRYFFFPDLPDVDVDCTFSYSLLCSM